MDMEKLLEESVPCRVWAKRGCAIHPRSIAERVRRTRISDGIRKLQELVPNMNKGWTIYEILRYALQHNWSAYEELLKTNPVFAKMVISGVVHLVGDWIAQCYEGKPLFDFDRTRMVRSELAGFALNGSLSHYYYEVCEVPFVELAVYCSNIVNVVLLGHLAASYGSVIK